MTCPGGVGGHLRLEGERGLGWNYFILNFATGCAIGVGGHLRIFLIRFGIR